MDERKGCEVLKRRFEAAGLSVRENVPLAGEGIDVVLDGFDPARRVGYEYVTTEAGDRAEVTPPVVAALEERIRRGELFVLLIDERDVADEATLGLAADRFLGKLREKGVLP